MFLYPIDWMAATKRIVAVNFVIELLDQSPQLKTWRSCELSQDLVALSL